MLRTMCAAALALGAGCDERGKATAPPMASGSAKAAVVADAAPPPIEVTGAQFYADYERGKDAADAKYRDRTVILHGIVKDKGSTVLQLMAPHRDHINAWFGANEAVALKPLRPHAEVIVRCRGDYMLDVPTLRDCVLEQVIDNAAGQ